jgi:poly-gamma-glutamate system protein
MKGTNQTAGAGSRVPTALGIVLTGVVVLMAFGVVTPIRWPQIGSATPASSPAATTAASCMRDALEAIAQAKDLAGLEHQGRTRSLRDAVIGSEWTPLVTTLGSLEAKQLTTSPEWAAVMADQIRARGIGAGSLAVASFSGSFPGLNIATVCACQALGVDLVAFSSVTASTWGATDAGFTWPEMEVMLARAGIIQPVSRAVSIGGDDDRGLDLEDDGRTLAASIAARSAAALGAHHVRAASLGDAMAERMIVLERASAGRPLRLFVNVGGTSASLGRSPAILRLRSGWLPPQPFDIGPERGLIARMVERGVPVLHLLNVRDLAAVWGIL